MRNPGFVSPASWLLDVLGIATWVVVKIMVPFWGPYYNTAPII